MPAAYSKDFQHGKKLRSARQRLGGNSAERRCRIGGPRILINGLVVIAQSSAAQGAEFEGMPVGVFTLPKAGGQTWSQFAKVYWDNTAKNFTTTATDNTLVGVAATVAASGALTGLVRLDGAAR